MSAEIVNLREPLLWVCACSCTTFQLFEDGTTKCGACGISCSHGGEWVASLPDPPLPGEPVKQAENYDKVVALLAPDTALRQILAMADHKNSMAVVIVQENGRVYTWGGVPKEESDETREWLKRRLVDDAYDLLTTWDRALPGPRELDPRP